MIRCMIRKARRMDKLKAALLAVCVAGATAAATEADARGRHHHHHHRGHVGIWFGAPLFYPHYYPRYYYPPTVVVPAPAPGVPATSPIDGHADPTRQVRHDGDVQVPKDSTPSLPPPRGAEPATPQAPPGDLGEEEVAELGVG